MFPSTVWGGHIRAHRTIIFTRKFGVGHSIFWGYQILCDTGTANMHNSVSAVPYFGERFLTNHNIVAEQMYLVERWRSITTDNGTVQR